MIRLTKQQATDLIAFVAEALTEKACNHKLNSAMVWAKDNQFDLEDFEDLMIEQGCGCDCEVVLNLPDDGTIAYYLSRIESQPIGAVMWCDFLERTGIGGFTVDLKINKAVR